MSRHDIRLLVTDDLDRSRLTVLLRLLLAIPHYIWIFLWSLVVVLSAFLDWLAALLLGRSPAPLRRFHARYVKYMTQLYAYLYLLADPYPSFDGEDGYPIDLAIAPAQRLSRWKVLLRIPLAVPAILLGVVLNGGGINISSRSSRGLLSGGLLSAVALLAWFVILARGRIPRGLRDAGAYSLSYGAQLWAYLLLVTDRYPDSDPIAALGEVPIREDPIALIGEDDLRRSRLTVFFRLPLVFPHLLWLVLWSILAWLAAIVNWLATLVRGRSPAALHRFLAAYVRYLISVNAFLYLVANPFPGFGGGAGAYPPLDIVIRAPERQGRWTVAFRLALALPTLLIQSAYSSLLTLVGIFGWFASLFTGRMPKGLRGLGALALRYQAQWLGYLLLLTGSYPYSGPCSPGSPGAGAEGQMPPERGPESEPTPEPGSPGTSWPIASPAGG
jgi:hypothetical protein